MHSGIIIIISVLHKLDDKAVSLSRAEIKHIFYNFTFVLVAVLLSFLISVTLVSVTVLVKFYTLQTQ